MKQNTKPKDLPETQIACRPFLKWAGGKSSLLETLLSRTPKTFGTYFEPFLGGGALFFALQPKRAVLSDINAELINAWQVVRNQPEELIASLKQHKYESEYYYTVRDFDRSEDFNKSTAVERASRLLYLNKTCFNGLYRVNSKGQFNVPFGSYSNPTIADPENIRACSEVLQSAELRTTSFSDLINEISQGDFIYLDPPYAPLSATSKFTSYAQEGFNLRDQQALAEFCSTLNNKGAQFMLTNSCTDLTLKLYKNFNLHLTSASRSINSKAEKRGKVAELCVTNYEVI